MEIRKLSENRNQLVLSKAEAKKVSAALLDKALQCNRSTLGLAYLTAESVLALDNQFRQPKSFLRSI